MSGAHSSRRPSARVPASPALALIVSLALTTSASSSPMKTPDIKQNPHPTMRYEITVTIDGAPGPFNAVEGYVLYQVANNQCIPLEPVSGATPVVEKRVPLVLTPVGDNVFKGTMYVDLMQDEDYFGMGVCHWTVAGLGANPKVKNLVFSPGITLNDIQAQRSVPRYFSNRSYFNADNPRVVTGNARRADFESEAKDTFSITLTAKEAVQ